MISAEAVLLSEYIDSLNRETPRAVPVLALNRGIAGIAYAGFLLGRAHGAPDLIAKSYSLMLKMLPFIDDDAAFEPEHANQHLERVRPLFQGSVIYGPPGYWFTLATLASELGEQHMTTTALNEFILRCSSSHAHAEFLFGSAGALWVC